MDHCREKEPKYSDGSDIKGEDPLGVLSSEEDLAQPQREKQRSHLQKILSPGGMNSWLPLRLMWDVSFLFQTQSQSGHRSKLWCLELQDRRILEGGKEFSETWLVFI